MYEPRHEKTTFCIWENNILLLMKRLYLCLVIITDCLSSHAFTIYGHGGHLGHMA